MAEGAVMILTLTPTGDFENVQGTPCRIWTGATASGVPVRVHVAVVQPQTHDPALLTAFEAALRAMPYRRELVSFDLRMVM